MQQKQGNALSPHMMCVYDEPQNEFEYDRVFPDYSTTADVFNYISSPLIDGMFFSLFFLLLSLVYFYSFNVATSSYNYTFLIKPLYKETNCTNIVE